MSILNENYFLWMKIFPIQPIRRTLYLIRNRRNTYLKRFSFVSSKDDKKLMLKYLLKYGLSYEEFYFFDVKNNNPEAFITECNRWKYFKKLNTIKGCKTYAKKGKTYELFSDLYGRDLMTVNSKDDYLNFTVKHSVFVYKDMVNGRGKGIKLYDTNKTDSEELWEKLKNRVPFVMEEPIKQGKETAVFHPESVNTIRIVTILTGSSPENYKVFHHQPFFKTGRGNSFVDNGGAGGILSAVSLDGTIITDGIDELINTYTKHPDTHVIFKGAKLPKFEEALKLTEKAALRYTENRCVGWDLAYTDEEKWVIVEGNSLGQFIGQQMCDKIGKKAELEEIISQI